MILGFMSCVPAFVYLIVMPETLNGGISGRKKTASMAVLEEEEEEDDHGASSEERRTVV